MQRRLVHLGVLLVCMIVSGAIGWLVGHWTGEWQERQLHFEKERDMVAPFLASDPAFGKVEVEMSTGPGGGIIMFGTVKSQSDLNRLRAEMVRLFGEPRAKELLDGVSLERRSDAPDPK